MLLRIHSVSLPLSVRCVARTFISFLIVRMCEREGMGRFHIVSSIYYIVCRIRIAHTHTTIYTIEKIQFRVDDVCTCACVRARCMSLLFLRLLFILFALFLFCCISPLSAHKMVCVVWFFSHFLLLHHNSFHSSIDLWTEWERRFVDIKPKNLGFGPFFDFLSLKLIFQVHLFSFSSSPEPVAHFIMPKKSRVLKMHLFTENRVRLGNCTTDTSKNSGYMAVNSQFKSNRKSNANHSIEYIKRHTHRTQLGCACLYSFSFALPLCPIIVVRVLPLFKNGFHYGFCMLICPNETACLCVHSSLLFLFHFCLLHSISFRSNNMRTYCSLHIPQFLLFLSL